MNSSEIFFMTIIAPKKQNDAIAEAVCAAGGLLVNTIYGKGALKTGYLMEALGIMSDEKKAIIKCAVSRPKAEAIFEILKTQFHFDKPNTGVAFTIPIDKVSL